MPNFDVIFEPHSWLRGWSRIKFIFKMADGRHIAEYWKRYNSFTNGPTWMKLGWSHPMISPICQPCRGCHDNGCCLATAHCTFSSFGRLEVERVNQFWWNLVHNSKLEPQWQLRVQILNFFKFKMAEGRHVGKYSKCHNSPTIGPTGTQIGCRGHELGVGDTCPRHFRHDVIAMATAIA